MAEKLSPVTEKVWSSTPVMRAPTAAMGSGTRESRHGVCVGRLTLGKKRTQREVVLLRRDLHLVHDNALEIALLLRGAGKVDKLALLQDVL